MSLASVKYNPITNRIEGLGSLILPSIQIGDLNISNDGTMTISSLTIDIYGNIESNGTISFSNVNASNGISVGGDSFTVSESGDFNSVGYGTSIQMIVNDVTYDAAWDSDFTVPTKNAVYNQMQIVNTTANIALDTANSALSTADGAAGSIGDTLSYLDLPIQSDQYTPTAIVGSNVTSVTAGPARYMYIGSGVCTVSGWVDATTTLGIGSSLFISLPVLNGTFASEDQLSGIASCNASGVFASGVVISESGGGSNAILQFPGIVSSSRRWYYVFTYDTTP